MRATEQRVLRVVTQLLRCSNSYGSTTPYLRADTSVLVRVLRLEAVASLTTDECRGGRQRRRTALHAFCDDIADLAVSAPSAKGLWRSALHLQRRLHSALSTVDRLSTAQASGSALRLSTQHCIIFFSRFPLSLTAPPTAPTAKGLSPQPLTTAHHGPPAPRHSCAYHGSPGTGGGREPPGTHNVCRTRDTRRSSEARPRADPGPAGSRVSPPPGRRPRADTHPGHRRGYLRG